MTPEKLKQIEADAEAYADKVHPFEWPKNKHGEDMCMPVGSSQPPFSKKHRKEQAKLSAAYIFGATAEAEKAAIELEAAKARMKELEEGLDMLMSSYLSIIDHEDELSGNKKIPLIKDLTVLLTCAKLLNQK